MSLELTGGPAPLLLDTTSEKPKPFNNVVSLSRLKASVENREKPSVDSLLRFPHPELGGDVLYGKMSLKGYAEVENVEQYGPSGTPVAGQKISDEKTDDMNTDLAYLMHAVWMIGEDGKPAHPTRDEAIYIYNLEGAGPTTRSLISAIKEINPPREHLSQRMARIYSMSTINSMFMRVVLEMGMGQMIIDYLAPSATPEEKALASHNLGKLEEIMVELEGYVNFKDAADKLGLQLKNEKGGS